MNNHVTLKEFLLANIGTLENPIAPKDLQVIVAGGDNDSIKYFDLRRMNLDRLRNEIIVAPDVELMGGDRSHPAILNSLLLTTSRQKEFVETVMFLGRYQTHRMYEDMPRVSASLYNLVRDGDFAYQSLLQQAFEFVHRGLSSIHRRRLDALFDERAIPIVDCGVYDCSAVRAASRDIELYIPLHNRERVAVWFVIKVDGNGNTSYNFTIRLSPRSEAIILDGAKIRDAAFTTLITVATQGYGE